ncbi:unnamed protein product, partial [Ostreobium quekettii]
GAGGPPPWLAVPRTLPQAFLEVHCQVRYVGANFNNRNIAFGGVRDAAPRGARVENPLLDLSGHRVHGAALGCGIVLKDMTLVSACGYLRSLFKLVLYGRHKVGRGVEILEALDGDVVLHDAVAADNATMRVNRFIGRGSWAQNVTVTVTCAEPGVRILTEPQCARAQRGARFAGPQDANLLGAASVGGDGPGRETGSDQGDVAEKLPAAALLAIELILNFASPLHHS